MILIYLNKNNYRKFKLKARNNEIYIQYTIQKAQIGFGYDYLFVLQLSGFAELLF